MQLDSVTELLGIANYKVAYMVRNSKERTDLVLRRIEETPCVCSGCGKVHHTPVHSTDTVIVEDLPISGKRVFLHVPAMAQGKSPPAICEPNLPADVYHNKQGGWLVYGVG
jgi:transposase